ncbi:DUF3142 domain-containing protein [Solilutibacter silvestris]|uniref:DUF3142 domain-containing protein n=1 Tax=Solilutibacter silvestris TaxID=1645665 RepID=A0A2K1Q211_9GAMM|nr:DUF3142 domain-containing protein [Lysobacter silvestris]PNS09073.1 hypothetical protein Lysil_0702 [Lysobacter silvestris]
MKPRALATLIAAGIAAGALCLALSSCLRSPDDVVHAEDHDAFWLWAGVQAQPVLDRARTLYLLEGEIIGGEPAHLSHRRAATPRIAHADVWIVYRADTLNWSEDVAPAIRTDIARWRGNGNRVVGVQLDFDARTRHLDRYVDFLRDFRAWLPRDTELGITGLMDWSANGNPAQLSRLTGIVDEVVVQTYQDRTTIPGYERYLERMRDFPIPFRVGLAQGGAWRAPPDLATNPQFRGYVVFLVNPLR